MFPLFKASLFSSSSSSVTFIFCSTSCSPLFSFFSALISASRDVTTHLWVGVGYGISCSRR